MAEHEEFLELCAGHALGCLGATDRAHLEAHLETGCRVCAAALEEAREEVLLLAHSAPAVTPPPRLRERVLAAAATARPRRFVADGEGEGRGRRPGSWVAVGWGLAALFAIAAAIGWIQWYGTRGELARLEQKLRLEEKWMAVLTSFEAKVLDLVRQETATESLWARATYDPATQRLIVVVDNMTPPAGRDYELWTLREGGPVSLGLIVAAEDGEGIVRLELAEKLAGATGFAISLEPKGGSPDPSAPSGPVVMAGTFASR